MSIFERLKNAIFGAQQPAGGAASTSRPVQPQAAPPVTPTAAAQAQAAGPPTSAPGSAPSGAGMPVDIEAVLNARAAQKHEKLNWQSSIVDLMKLVDLDSSFENRKALAKELGYTGDTQDSASMNIWLHKQVMQKLAASGGKVPDSLRH